MAIISGVNITDQGEIQLPRPQAGPKTGANKLPRIQHLQARGGRARQGRISLPGMRRANTAVVGRAPRGRADLVVAPRARPAVEAHDEPRHAGQVGLGDSGSQRSQHLGAGGAGAHDKTVGPHQDAEGLVAHAAAHEQQFERQPRARAQGGSRVAGDPVARAAHELPARVGGPEARWTPWTGVVLGLAREEVDGAGPAQARHCVDGPASRVGQVQECEGWLGFVHLFLFS